MLKTINIELKYDVQDEKFKPISITYESESHMALAYFLANIIYFESKRNPCFMKHVNGFVKDKLDKEQDK